MKKSITVGIHAAAAIVGGVSPQALAYRALVGQRVRLARRSPMRFRVADLIEARAELQRRDPRGRRPLAERLQEIVS
jgi:hypothetical protein